MAGGVTPLVGTWKLVSWELESQETGKRHLPGGPDPKGYLVITPEGRLIALLIGSNRRFGQSEAEESALLRSMLSYTGMCEVRGDQFITNVDASWNEVWNGTRQVRNFKIDGPRMDIVSAWLPNPHGPGGEMIRGILCWERVA
jgi:hypothetical protein